MTLINASPNNSCQLHPIPTWMLKECTYVLITAMTTIINQSISQSTMTDGLKMVHITLLLKKLKERKKATYPKFYMV